MLEKKYKKSGQVCTVTFSLPEATEAESACLVGEFNGWAGRAAPDRKHGPMRVRRPGLHPMRVQRPGQA